MATPGARTRPSTPSRRSTALVGAVAAAASAAVAFAVGLGLVWVRQERIVWQPPRVRPEDRETPPGAERVDYVAADGQPLFAYVVRPAARHRPATERVLMSFHGNAEIAAWSVPWAREVARRTGYTVVLPEYRGYAGLPGSPNYDCSRRDAHAAYSAVIPSDRRVPGAVALFGHSLGTAVAVELADDLTRAGTPPRSLVLQSPFTSARAMARIVVSEGAERWWMRISRVHFDTEALVAELDIPVWVAHGERDLIIPVRMGRQVHARARRPGELLLVDSAGHNDVEDVGGWRYWAWLERALAIA
jgi:hypothetical protein